MSRNKSSSWRVALIAGSVFLAFLFVVRGYLDTHADADLSAHGIAETPGASKVYGMMVDAGSTGSRMHTFVFEKDPKTGALNLLYEDFYPIKPGLSAYKDNPAEAARSVQQLLDQSAKIVPAEFHKATPVFLRATAGLRLVGEPVANQILGYVRQALRASPFRFDKDDWVSILAGNDEAVYSWITVNYLLKSPPDSTIGTLEMGGGSAQIAFVPREAPPATCAIPTEPVTYKGRDLKLYTTSHLGYGLKQATATVMKRMAENQAFLSSNPCLLREPSGSPQTVAIPFEEGKTVSMVGAGDFDMCLSAVESILAQGTGSCTSCGVCSYGGAPQPKSIPQYVAFAFYKERTVGLGLKSPVTMGALKEKARQVCKMTLSEAKDAFPHVDNGSPSDLCFDLTFIYTNLKDGHGIPAEGMTNLQVVSKIQEVELGWSLGAMFHELSGLGLGG